MSKELARTDQPFFTISFKDKGIDTLQYYKDEIERLNKIIEEKDNSLQDFKKKVNQIIDKGKYFDTVEKFRDMNLIKCFIDNNFKITLFQCKDKIDNKKCKMFKMCKTRKEFLNKILPLSEANFIYSPLKE